MIRFRNYLPLVAVLAGAAILGAPAPARATFQLYIQEYTAAGATVGAAQTFNGTEPGAGVGVIFGAIGSTANFTFSFNASQNSATGKPPSLHLDNFSIGTGAVTTDYLVIGLTEGGPGHGYSATGLNTLISNLSSIAGLGNAVVTLQSFGDNNNNAYGVPIGTTVPPPGNPFVPPLVGSAAAVAAPTITMNSGNSGAGITTTAFFAAVPHYSLTQVATVTGLEEGQTISFNATTVVTPAPDGLVLALAGLPCLGLYYLRRRVKLTPA